jgi:hypothetical protein
MSTQKRDLMFAYRDGAGNELRANQGASLRAIVPVEAWTSCVKLNAASFRAELQKSTWLHCRHGASAVSEGLLLAQLAEQGLRVNRQPEDLWRVRAL